MDKKLLDIIACPVCKGKLKYWAEQKELVCSFDRLAYPIDDGIPVLIVEQARLVSLEELQK